MYILRMIREEYLSIKKDKVDGIQKSVLQLYKYEALFKSTRDNVPTIPVATFRIGRTDKYITLSGDYSNAHLENGKFYYVRYYKNTHIMIEIKERRAASKSEPSKEEV